MNKVNYFLPAPVRLVVGALILILPLIACNVTTPTHSEAKAKYDEHDPIALYNIATGAWKSWEINHSLNDITKANKLFRQAYNLQPDNVNIQKGYYTTSLILNALGSGPDTQEIKSLFTKLNPILRKQVASPGRLAYLDAVKSKAHTKTLVRYAKEAIVIHPHDAYMWNQYSLLMEQEKHYWFSAALAKRAVELSPESGEYHFQLANAIDDIARHKVCRYDESALAKKTISYLTQATKLEKNNSLYLSEAAYQYLSLGIIPIAYQQAKKSYALKKNSWSATNYAISAMLLKKYNEATQVAKSLVDELNAPWGYIYLMQIAISQGDWHLALKHFDDYAEHNTPSLPSIVSYQWAKIFATQNFKIDTSTLETSTLWENKVKVFLADYSEANRDNSITSLIHIAANSCQRTEAHFYTALYQTLNNEKDAARKQLDYATKQGTPLHPEHLWATAFLRGAFSR